jgi:hypothetical protein
MKTQQWPNALTVELNGVSKRYARIRSTRDAAYFLIDSWRGERDATYREAVIHCTMALRGEMKDDVALDSFMRAARSSRIPFQTASDISLKLFERELKLALRHSLHDEAANQAKPTFT